MIQLTDSSGQTHYLHRDAVAQVIEAQASSQWHGIRAFVKTFDGRTIEARETAHELATAIKESK